MWCLQISEITWADDILKFYFKCRWYFRIYLGNIPVSILFRVEKILRTRTFTVLSFPRFQFWVFNMPQSLYRLTFFLLFVIKNKFCHLCALPFLSNFRIEVTKFLKFENFYSEYIWTTWGFKMLFKGVINNGRFIIYLIIYMKFIYIKLKHKWAEIFFFTLI